jgi:aspartate beta-hydroxylase
VSSVVSGSVAAPWLSDARLSRADGHLRRGEVLQAELLFRATLNDHKDCAPAARALAAMAGNRGDFAAANHYLALVEALVPNDAGVMIDRAHVQIATGVLEQARATLERVVALHPQQHVAWLMLADTRDACGDSLGALKARYQGITRAQESGRWLDERTTDPEVLQAVLRNMQSLQKGQYTLLMQTLDGLTQELGRQDLSRVARAVSGYLGEWDATPPDPRQRPKFFYFPDLPPGPYHDPMLHPWAGAWRDSWQDVRDEAASLLAEDKDFESFLGLRPGQSAPEYVGGTNPNASWDAYFFYRRGERFDDHHARCPKTSAALDAIDLCRVAHQAPEVCFSVIRPQSTIMPHHGVTNTRLVMHLPLIIPGDCALNIVDGEPHHWREGELMMFDDTYQHGAWNHTDQARLIVLMDCWNPHLTPAERVAVTRIIELIDTIQR